mmetsp:Transcript_61216/g.173874  ORF Transcript_61216/g.173874 Transcript_61216/m.173874 type:complete len:127 (+) Transcript_61216:334-714(+)
MQVKPITAAWQPPAARKQLQSGVLVDGKTSAQEPVVQAPAEASTHGSPVVGLESRLPTLQCMAACPTQQQQEVLGIRLTTPGVVSSAMQKLQPATLLGVRFPMTRTPRRARKCKPQGPKGPMLTPW